MLRKIVRIDEELCNGCGLCITACHEGALQLVDGKAKLVSDSYCDGLGNCLPECPTGAITIEEREAVEFDEQAVQSRIKGMKAAPQNSNAACGCPGSRAMELKTKEKPLPAADHTAPAYEAPVSQLRQWPCQIKLVPVNAPYFNNANLLIAADCTAYAHAGIHNDFMRNKITLIGCPKLDDVDYSDKLTAILRAHDIRSITVLRMEVPCCGGIVHAVKQAMFNSGKMIPWSVVTIGADGSVLEG